MSRIYQTAELLKGGHEPAAISAQLGISVSSVFTYLDRAVGEGLIRRSDIYFSVPPEKRSHPTLARYASATVAFGDLYNDVRQIEVRLHDQVRRTLLHHYGDGDLGWWRQGVPESVRVKCQERREKDSDAPCDPYCYTDLIDLEKIIDAEWALFKDVMPSCYCSNKKIMSEHLKRFNRIRNKVMHTVRGATPTEDDFDFVHTLDHNLGPSAGAA